MTVVDVHNHAAPRALLDLLRGRPGYGAAGADPLRTDPAAKLAQLTGNGIDVALVSILPTLHGYDLAPVAGEEVARAANAGLRDYAAAAPDRLRWMAHLPLGAPDRVAGVLADAVRDGAVGVAVGTSVGRDRLDAPAYEPLWEGVARLGVPVFVHPNYPWAGGYPGLDDFHFQNVLGHPLETTITVERLICAGVLDRYPRLRLVLAHGGGYFPFQAGRLRHARTVRPELRSAPADPLAYRGQVCVDTITHDAAALRYVIDRMGAENVLLGTDLPADMATPEPLAALAEAADPDTVRTITETNPKRLYGVG
jgi:aminocarboxymuconate-semialdehyde decarboxylase